MAKKRCQGGLAYASAGFQSKRAVRRHLLQLMEVHIWQHAKPGLGGK